jgi:hypothetical protein
VNTSIGASIIHTRLQNKKVPSNYTVSLPSWLLQVESEKRAREGRTWPAEEEQAFRQEMQVSVDLHRRKQEHAVGA